MGLKKHTKDEFPVQSLHCSSFHLNSHCHPSILIRKMFKGILYGSLHMSYMKPTLFLISCFENSLPYILSLFEMMNVLSLKLNMMNNLNMILKILYVNNNNSYIYIYIYIYIYNLNTLSIYNPIIFNIYTCFI